MRFIHKYFMHLLISGLILGAISCEGINNIIVDCDECEDYELDSANLIIYVTTNAENPVVPIVLYRGDVEEGNVDFVDTAYESTHKIYSAMDQFYSVTAEYKVGGKTVIAVDGDKMKIRNEDEACGSPCWIVSGGYFKVELKFDD